ncbi:MAG: DUF4340 domain-containing protein [Planctomycetaceae bacterium]|nr:DUF4340 domain-containing protein [Planctomycetaceae bacterium]
MHHRIADLTDETMNEIAKTSIFIILAAALVAGAYWSRPKLTDFQPEEMVGQSLFPQFTDPLAIKSLEIVKFNAAGERSDFRIAEVNGIWSIPSHDNYPADAKDQMGRVAEALTDLTVLEVIPPEESGIDAVAFQTQYGVIDPTADNVSFSEGVGTKITLGGANNETLVNLIIGKTVAKSPSLEMNDDEGTSLRYARIAHQSPVYVVSIDPSQFSTNFDQWIEKNLLDISTLDMKEIFVDQYSLSVDFVLTNAGVRPQSKFSPIGDLNLGYDGSAVGAEKWSLARWMTFAGQNYEYKEQQLSSEKELDVSTLDSMVSALNDLKIVSVQKKPAKLASALRGGEAFEQIEMDEAMQESMQETGFWLVEMPDLKGDVQKQKTQLLSNEGDLQLRLKDGVIYHLRFGDLTGTESEIVSEDTPNETPVMGVNRYLFITAEFEPAMIPPPEFRPVPEVPEDGEGDAYEELKTQKEQAERANQREQKRYDDAIESGKKRAADLSDRFAGWYYVISEDVYKKIHLTDANVFRIKVPDSESAGEGMSDGFPDSMILPDLPNVDFEVESPDGDSQEAEKTPDSEIRSEPQS